MTRIPNEPPDDPVWEGNGDNGVAFVRYDLRALAKTGVEPPKLFGHDLLYPGGVHSLSSEPDVGKTTMALWFALEVLREGGRVAIFDEEGGPEMTYEKLAGLGAGEDELEQLAYYPFPSRMWTDADIAVLGAEARELKPNLMIFDSSAAFMARAGLDENAAGDVTRFYLKVISPLARKEPHAAVLIIDHDAKTDGPGGKGGRYARGNGAKLAAIDVQFKLAAVHEFSRTTAGTLTLGVTKDRRGWIHPRKYRIQVRNPLEIWFSSDAERLAGERDDALSNLTPAEEKVYGCLTDQSAGVSRIIDRCNMKYGHPLRQETVQRALAKLAGLGLAEQTEAGGGRGNLAAWVKARPSEPQMFGSDGGPSL